MRACGGGVWSAEVGVDDPRFGEEVDSGRVVVGHVTQRVQTSGNQL